MRRLALLVPFVVLAACGSNGLSSDEKQACQSVTRDATAGLSAAGADLRSLDRQAIAGDYDSAGQSIRSDIAPLKSSSKIRKDSERLAGFYAGMAHSWATSPSGVIPQMPAAMDDAVKQLDKACS